MPLANAERDYGRRHPPNGVRRDKNFSFGGWMRSCGQAGAERRPGSSENCRLRHDDAARQRLQFMLSVMCADAPESERKVVAALRGELSLSQIADPRQITRGTVRTALKRVFAKANVRRQSPLVSKLLKL